MTTSLLQYMFWLEAMEMSRPETSASADVQVYVIARTTWIRYVTGII